VEPASAAGLAGLAIEIESGELKVGGKRVVAICTGHGLKDPEIITKDMQKPLVVPPRLEALEDVLLGEYVVARRALPDDPSTARDLPSKSGR
jgi:threonine synthase